MIRVNDREMNWHDDMSLFEVFQFLEYKLKVPVVLVHVNGQMVKKSLWQEYRVADNVVIKIYNIVCGG